MKNADYFINKLNLKKHPEGGFYHELYSSSESISDDELSKHSFSGQRKLITSIYFLLEKNDVSHFHSLKSDELWFYHYGSSLTLFLIFPNGKLEKRKLGFNIENGELPQVLVPAGCIYGAVLNDTNWFSLVGCVVSPGFDFQDFTLYKREDLLKKYPQHKDIIIKLTQD